ncbi:hypothetical protein LCGC14_3115060, partial [marine sediment metagenome]
MGLKENVKSIRKSARTQYIKAKELEVLISVLGDISCSTTASTYISGKTSIQLFDRETMHLIVEKLDIEFKKEFNEYMGSFYYNSS